jgi:hypothetical protein
MARKPTQQQLLDELLSRYETAIADAFRAAVADLKSAADIQRLITALKINDLAGALEALHLDVVAYNQMLGEIQAAYGEGGRVAAESLPPIISPEGLRLVVRFDGRNPRAEAWLRLHSSELITNVVNDQRTAVRNALVAGMERSEHPTKLAQTIVGEINRATGKREGGILGLSVPQERYLATARGELASADKDGLRNYLTRARRDKRFDRTVEKALRDGTPVSPEVAAKAVDGYGRRLLKLRGDTIGRNEALTALNAANYENTLQLVEKGTIAESQVRRVWRAAHDLRTRRTHAVLDGKAVGLKDPFLSPSGARMLFPGDTSLGASPGETINCRCACTTKLDLTRKT